MTVDTDPRGPLVHVLLATYQGAHYLEDQLASIAAQTHVHWCLTISDDGSQDRTVAICEAFAQQHPAHKIRIIQGPRRRSTANFLHLIHTVTVDSADTLFAFCDQDDVWLPNKLTRAVNALNAMGAKPGQAALYGAATQLVDAALRPIGLSRKPARALGFGNALLQNVASGNTMVFNARLLRLMRLVRPENSVLHDWTAYQVVTGCGGLMHFDPEPCLLYRQHANNVVGAQGRSWDKVQRIGMLFKGKYRTWGDQTEAAMNDLLQELTPQAKLILRNFEAMRRQPGMVPRLAAGRRSGLWRQTRSGRASFWLGLALNRM